MGLLNIQEPMHFFWTHLKFINGVLERGNVRGNIWKSNAKHSDRIYLTQVLFFFVRNKMLSGGVSK